MKIFPSIKVSFYRRTMFIYKFIIGTPSPLTDVARIQSKIYSAQQGSSAVSSTFRFKN